MQYDTIRTRNLSQRASKPSSSAGSSLLAAINAFIGSDNVLRPFWKIRSLMAVSNAFCIDGLAFHISSRNTMVAVGRNPSTTRSYLSSFLSMDIDTGPKISSGVLKRDMRYSKAFPSLNASFRRRATKLFAVPGGPSRKILSPAMALSNDMAMICSFSYTPCESTFSNDFI